LIAVSRRPTLRGPDGERELAPGDVAVFPEGQFRHEGRRRQMLYACIDIHKAVFQAVVLDPETGELGESRFEPPRGRLSDWAMQWQGKLAAVAIEATTGWRWVARELQALGFDVHLVDLECPVFVDNLSA
jgi:hypothetical protein